MLKTQFYKKRTIFRAKKLFRPIVSRIIEYEKPQGTRHKGPQGIVRITVQVIRSFPQDLRYDIDENTFSKKAYFADEKQFWSFFSRITESGTP